jgi:hypothetical protein
MHLVDAWAIAWWGAYQNLDLNEIGVYIFKNSFPTTCDTYLRIGIWLSSPTA